MREAHDRVERKEKTPPPWGAGSSGMQAVVATRAQARDPAAS
jgi:hypothetical protein